ncbi:MAG: hypothetical protein J6S69_00305 [Proteobacteria bacterium]|nr:hypothetical protein [Pseudomonadota bacterium]
MHKNIEPNKDELKNSELDAIEDPTSEALLSEESVEGETIDWNHTDTFEVVFEDETPKDKHDAQRQEAKKRMLSMEIARQKGVEIHGNRITVPGRVSLTPITLLAILLSVIGFASSFIHFSILAANYLLAVFITEFIIFAQIVIYHSSYRARRTAMGIIHVLGCLAVVALVDWAFLDIIFHPKTPEEPHAILGIATIAYACVPLLLMVHFVYLGRGKREIYIKRKKTQADKPTKIIKTEADKPTKIIKSPA